MKLRCVHNYRNDARGLRYLAGQVFDADPATVQFLCTDAPGCFAVDKQVDRPPRNKAVRRPARKK